MIIDMTNPVSRVRVRLGDTNDVPIIEDKVYAYYLEQHGGNESYVVREVAYVILGVLSQNTRKRLDRIETFGQQAFDQYLKFIQQVINNPLSGLTTTKSTSKPLGCGMGYVGGISVSDFNSNLSNPDNLVTDMPLNAWGR